MTSWLCKHFPKLAAYLGINCGAPPPPPPPKPPIITMDVSPLLGDAPLKVTVALWMQDPNKGGAGKYAIDFGDGSVVANQTYVEHVYATPGSYIITGTVTNAAGLSASKLQVVDVITPPPPPPPPEPIPPTAALVATSPEFLTAKMDASGSQAGTEPIVTYIFDTGDGWSTSQADPILTYVYEAAGTYAVGVEVVDARGLSAGAPALVTVEAPPPPPPPPTKTGALLGSAPDFATTNGAPNPVKHSYGGPRIDPNINTWNKPIDDAWILNMRPWGKPPAKITTSLVAPLFGGLRNGLIDQWIADVARLDHTVLGTFWHEPLDKAEFLDSEDRHLWAEAFLYVMDRFDMAGVDNIRWTSCLMGSQYRTLGGDYFHTPELLDALYAVGSDSYLGMGNINPATDGDWTAFENYHPEKPHTILEWGLRDSFGINGSQPPAIEMVADYFKAHPNYVTLCGWFNNGPNGDSRLNPDGAAALSALCLDPYFTREVVA
jgi:hypothetical protein